MTLGSKILEITNGGDTFSGVISGTGGLTVSGGTETLTGANTYTGATTITAGIVKIAGAGSISSAGAVSDNGMFDISAANGPTVSLGSLAGRALLRWAPTILISSMAAATFSPARFPARAA